MKCYSKSRMFNYYVVTEENIVSCLLIVLNAKFSGNKVTVKAIDDVELSVGDYIVCNGKSCIVLTKEKFDELFAKVQN